MTRLGRLRSWCDLVLLGGHGGTLLAHRRPAELVGWLLLVLGLATTISEMVGGYVLYAVTTRCAGASLSDLG